MITMAFIWMLHRLHLDWAKGSRGLIRFLLWYKWSRGAVPSDVCAQNHEQGRHTRSRIFKNTSEKQARGLPERFHSYLSCTYYFESNDMTRGMIAQLRARELPPLRVACLPQCKRPHTQAACMRHCLGWSSQVAYSIDCISR